MNTYLAIIEITGLAGTKTRNIEIKAKTLASATKKAWAIIGNQTGQVLEIKRDVKLTKTEKNIADGVDWVNEQT